MHHHSPYVGDARRDLRGHVQHRLHVPGLTTDECEVPDFDPARLTVRPITRNDGPVAIEVASLAERDTNAVTSSVEVTPDVARQLAANLIRVAEAAECVGPRE